MVRKYMHFKPMNNAKAQKATPMKQNTKLIIKADYIPTKNVIQQRCYKIS